jgi:hypothetical protein
MTSYLRDPERPRLPARFLRRSLVGRCVSVFCKGDYLVIAVACGPLLTTSTVESVAAAVMDGLPRLHGSTVLQSTSAHLAPFCDHFWLLLALIWEVAFAVIFSTMRLAVHDAQTTRSFGAASHLSFMCSGFLLS